MCWAILLPGTFSSSRSALWALCLCFCLALLAGLYVWSCVAREIVSLRSKLKSNSDTTSESVLPPSILNLQDWRQTTKKITGAAIALAVVSVAGLWYSVKSGPVYEYHDVRIVERHSDLHFTFANENGPFTLHFCKDYHPDLRVGFVLWWLRYEDRGDCVSVARFDLGYKYKRDAQGLAIKEQ